MGMKNERLFSLWGVQVLVGNYTQWNPVTCVNATTSVHIYVVVLRRTDRNAPITFYSTSSQLITSWLH